MKDSSLDLIISIVNYNTKDFLYQCLSSIYSASIPLDYQVYVVDNNSLDGSQEMVETCFPSVSLIRNKQNIGFGRSNNLVMKNTNSKYILTLNPDVTVMPKSIENIINFMDMQYDVGALGCKLLNPDRSLQFSCRRFPNALTIFLRGLYTDLFFPNAHIFKHYMMADWNHSTVAEVDWVMGSCLMLRRDALKEVGLFDESFFMYCEDVDLCLRMWKSWKVCYFPHSYMIHQHLQESQRLSAIRQRLIHTMSLYRFFRKHGLFPQRKVRYRNIVTHS